MPPTNNRGNLAVDLEVNDRDATARVDAFFRKLEAVNSDINNLGKNSTFARDFAKDLAGVERRANQTQRAFLSLIQTPTKGNTLDGLSLSAARLQKESAEVAKRLRDIRAVDTRGKSDSFIKILSEDAAAAEFQLARLERRAESLQKRRPGAGPGRGSEIGEGIADGLGLPTSAGAGAAIAAGAVAVIGKQSLDAARDAANAQLQLQSIAKETGQSYDTLKLQAKAFGDQTALSNTKAESTFAQLVNFANAAGRTDKLEEFRKRFADLAAAKGINADQLGDISRQLNALTDEATDKLLNANPSAFYDAFAKSLGKTAEQLTDAEKRAAVFDEVLKKGAIFDGTAEKRVAGAAGAMDVFGKTFDNAKTKIGAALIPLVEFSNAAIRLITADPAKFTSQAVLDEIAKNAKIEADKRTDETVKGLRAMDAKIAAAQKAPRASLQNFALSGLNITDNFNDPIKRQASIDAAVKNAETFVADLTKRLQKSLSSGGDQKFARREFQLNINLFDADTREKFIKDFSAASADGFRKILADAKATLPEIRKVFKDATRATELTSEDRDRLTKDFTAAIEKAVNDGKAKIEEIGKTTDALFDSLFAASGSNNPFVRVFTEADKAIENTRLATALLSKDLQNTALDMVRQQNALELFNARANSALDAFDLRESAAGFRSFNNRPADSTKVDQETIDRVVKQFIERRDAVAGGGTFAPNLGIDFTKLTEDQKRDLFERQTIQNLRGAGQPDQLIASFLASQRRANDPAAAIDANLSIQQRLDKQIAIINGLNPQNDAERQAADRRIIALTGGLRPEQLTENQRRAAADTREREALRIETAEQKAREQRAEQLDTQKRIDKNIQGLLKIAQSDGLTGVIRIINEAEDKTKVSLGLRPTNRDTARLME
jgi:hypothetical protein